MKKRFEYRVIHELVASDRDEMVDFNRALDKQGADGWELVSVVKAGQDGHALCIFKRELFSGILPKQNGNSWEGAADIRS